MSTPWPVDRAIPEPDWRPPPDAVVISADDHLVEHDLWVEYLPAADRDRAPRVSHDETGFHLTLAGQSLDTPGYNSLIVEGRPGMADVGARLADMDGEGVHASFLYAGRAMGLFAQLDDKDSLVRCIDAYNAWLADLQQHAPHRLFGVAILPTMYEPDATADYVAKLRELGFVALQLPSYPKDVRYNASAMEPLWDAIEAGGIPLSFHIGGSSSYRGAGALGTSVTTALQPFRELWVRPKLAQLPSYYWNRQCYATFMNDPAGLKLVDEIGPEHMLWSVDYPHPESNLGENVEVMHDIFATLGEPRARDVVGGNAARVWGLDATAILEAAGVLPRTLAVGVS